MIQLGNEPSKDDVTAPKPKLNDKEHQCSLEGISNGEEMGKTVG